MPTFVYMTRCDGCGHCVDICPSDIMHIDETYRRAYNIEPNMCWECYSCVKACPQHAIDVRGYADFAPLGHSVRVDRDERKGTIAWRIKFRDGTEKNFLSVPRRRGAPGTGRAPDHRHPLRPPRLRARLHGRLGRGLLRPFPQGRGARGPEREGNHDVAGQSRHGGGARGALHLDPR